MSTRTAPALALFAAIGLTTLTATLPALADSTSSVGLSASSMSLGSVSDSLQTSSDSSSQHKAAPGAYTVQDMKPVDNQPHLVQVRLVALAAAPATGPTTTPAARQPAEGTELLLTLPRQATERVHLTTGSTVLAQQRPYGLAFASVTAPGATTPFFLVLQDTWHRELDSHPVGG